ncbi:MAG: 30S ribosomal protein S4 [Chitinophagales bacterium]|jgi:small subunit ribosomal protein S4|tara:strand:- start:21390 stop:21995 length:606 start_codon:yes stop_codon:yes gene_type:complete
MARYIGPKTKIARKFGEAIYGDDKYFDRRKYSPGQHGSSKRRKSVSDYGVQLKEKQKAKYTYGLLERQFRNTFKKASRKEGVTGENLLQALESRLDNVVYRMGIAKTRTQARQFVGHKHILVNGDIVNIPSFHVRPGDEVEVRERSKSMDPIQEAIAGSNNDFAWIQFDTKVMKGKLLELPAREDIPENINEQLIVELYSK